MARKLKRPLNEDTHFIKRGKFSMDTAKIYLIITIIVFHILPPVLLFSGKMGVNVLFNVFLLQMNVIAIAAVGGIYGAKEGYNFKFPLILTGISVLTFVLYYYDANLFVTPENYITTGIMTLIVYALFSFLSTAVGGWLKRFF